MKRLIALLVALVFAAGSAATAMAQTATTPAAPEKKMEKADEMKKADDKKAEKKMAAKNANGTVKTASAGSVLVAGKEKGKDAEWTFSVDSKTAIKKGGKAVTAGDLKAGDEVHVRYMEHDGKAVAQAITVKAGGTAKKDEPMAKKDEKKADAKPAEKTEKK